MQAILDHFGVSWKSLQNDQDRIGQVALFHPAVRAALQKEQLSAEEARTLLPEVPPELQEAINRASSLSEKWLAVPDWQMSKLLQTLDDPMKQRSTSHVSWSPSLELPRP